MGVTHVKKACATFGRNGGGVREKAIRRDQLLWEGLEDVLRDGFHAEMTGIAMTRDSGCSLLL